MRSLRKPLCTIVASILGLTVSLLILLVCAGTARQTSAGKEQYVRLSKPNLLTFDERVELEKTDEPTVQLAVRLDQLLHTPVISNEAYLSGAKPNRPLSDALGPFLRATMWNIERGIALDGIKIALTEPDNYGKYIEEKKDPKSKPLTAKERGDVNKQLVDFVTREGLLPAVILLVLPFVVLFVLIKILPPWHEENIATLQAQGID